MNQLTSLINRVLFLMAFALAGLGVCEKLANLFGYTMIWVTYSPGQLLQFAGIALLFVFALLLRDIQHALVPRNRP